MFTGEYGDARFLQLVLFPCPGHGPPPDAESSGDDDQRNERRFSISRFWFFLQWCGRRFRNFRRVRSLRDFHARGIDRVPVAGDDFLKLEPASGGIVDAFDLHPNPDEFLGVRIRDIHAEGALAFFFQFERGV